MNQFSSQEDESQRASSSNTKRKGGLLHVTPVLFNCGTFPEANG
jgi:hypothetical protein